MSLTMTVAQQLLLRVRKKRQKHSFCGLEAFLGQAHVHVQEDNTPQEQVLITTTAHQAITGGVCLSQGFWAFYGVGQRNQQQQQQLDDDEHDNWERPCLCFQDEDTEGEEQEEKEETVTPLAAQHHHHQQQHQQQVDERKQAFERFFRSHWTLAQAALTEEMLDRVWLEVETGQSAAAVEVEQQEARRQQQQVRRCQQEDAGGSFSGKDGELHAAAFEQQQQQQQQQQQHEADEGQGREQMVWVNPWEISEARKVQLLAMRHVKPQTPQCCQAWL